MVFSSTLCGFPSSTRIAGHQSLHHSVFSSFFITFVVFHYHFLLSIFRYCFHHTFFFLHNHFHIFCSCVSTSITVQLTKQCHDEWKQTLFKSFYMYFEMYVVAQFAIWPNLQSSPIHHHGHFMKLLQPGLDPKCEEVDQ